MNGNDGLSCDGQLLVKQVTPEPPNQPRPEQQPAPTSHRKKKCRGNRKEQHARRRLRKRDLDGSTKVARVKTTTETELPIMNTEMTDEPSDSMIAPMEEMTQV